MQGVNLSPYPHSLQISSPFLILSPFPLHFLILSSFSRSQAAIICATRWQIMMNSETEAKEMADKQLSSAFSFLHCEKWLSFECAARSNKTLDSKRQQMNFEGRYIFCTRFPILPSHHSVGAHCVNKGQCSPILAVVYFLSNMHCFQL